MNLQPQHKIAIIGRGAVASEIIAHVLNDNRFKVALVLQPGRPASKTSTFAAATATATATASISELPTSKPAASSSELPTSKPAASSLLTSQPLPKHTTEHSVNTARAQSTQADLKVLFGINELLAWQPDLVIEAAGKVALQTYAAPCLAAGISVIAASVGALADAELYTELSIAAQCGRSKLILPSGAVGALDYLSATRFATPAADAPTRIVYESRKPPAAWQDVLAQRGLPLSPDAPITLFEGSAREAAKLFPQNLNVAATIALAGAGMEHTQVSVVVDPAAQGNTHTVTATGPFGSITTQIKNRPSPTNPKTSWVMGLSMIAAIDRYFAAVVVG
jgi:aspartate dehydrogenase